MNHTHVYFNTKCMNMFPLLVKTTKAQNIHNFRRNIVSSYQLYNFVFKYYSYVQYFFIHVILLFHISKIVFKNMEGLASRLQKESEKRKNSKKI